MNRTRSLLSRSLKGEDRELNLSTKQWRGRWQEHAPEEMEHKGLFCLQGIPMVQALTKSAGAYIAKRREGQREDVGRGCMSKGKEVRNSMEYVKSHESWHKAQRKK